MLCVVSISFEFSFSKHRNFLLFSELRESMNDRRLSIAALIRPDSCFDLFSRSLPRVPTDT